MEIPIRPLSTVPDTLAMEWNYLTSNGRCGPLTTPLLCKLGERVRIRFVNFSVIDHHPLHLHGHTFWITGTEGGRMPEPSRYPSNSVWRSGLVFWPCSVSPRTIGVVIATYLDQSYIIRLRCGDTPKVECTIFV